MAEVFLTVDSISCVNLNNLSQSDLKSLSLTSPTSFDLCNTQDVIVPTLNPSIFNQSSATLRQTYSSSLLSPTSLPSDSSPDRRPRRRSSGLLPSPRHHSAVPDDIERRENVSIINCLKNLLGSGSAIPKQELDLILYDSSMETLNRKRDFDSRSNFFGVTNLDVSMDVLNDGGGGSVDLNRKDNGGCDPFAEELRRRTAGMNSEDKLISFLKDLGGQWGSRRKKRKIVDASVLGDELPSGWKILIGIRRKVGNLSLYCRRYISPEGQLFLTCKEARSYLQSYCGPNRDDLPPPLFMNCETQHTPISESERFIETDTELHNRDDTLKGDNNMHFSVPALPPCGDTYEKEDPLLGIDNLADVQVRDVFDCHKCRMTFDEKDTYLQHLLAYHQRATRRYRLGTSVSDGVIIKDGKYECQFCHKVFEERRRYNGHVGVHVRNYVRNSEESSLWLTPKNTSTIPKDDLPSTSEFPVCTKMDVLVDIARSSIPPTGGSTEFIGRNEPSNSDSSATRSNDSSPRCGSLLGNFEVERGAVDSILSEEENRFTSMDVDIEEMDGVNKSSGLVNCDHMIDGTDDIFGIEDDDTDVNDGSESETLSVPDTGLASPLVGHMADGISGALNITDNDLVNEMEYVDSGIFIGVKESSNGDAVVDHNFSRNSLNEVEDDNVGVQTELDNFEDNMRIQHGCVQASPRPLFPLPCSIRNKEGGGEEEMKEGKVERGEGGFEELRLEEIENLGQGFITNEGVDDTFPPIPEQPIPETTTGGRRQFVTVCVWCRLEFNHVISDSEIQTDSVGFMCHSCKTKISGQLNLLGAAFSSSSSPHL